MVKLEPIKIDIGKVVKRSNMELTVTLKGYSRFKVRLTLAIWLIKLASIILYGKVVIKEEDES